MNDFKGVMEAFTDRLSSPVTGTFSIVWFLLHWQIPIVLIFGSKQQDRIEFIKAYLLGNDVFTLFAYPAAFTLLYILASFLFKIGYFKLFTHYEYLIKSIKANADDQFQTTRNFGTTHFKINEEFADSIVQSNSVIQNAISDIKSFEQEGKVFDFRYIITYLEKHFSERLTQNEQILTTRFQFTKGKYPKS